VNFISSNILLVPLHFELGVVLAKTVTYVTYVTSRTQVNVNSLNTFWYPNPSPNGYMHFSFVRHLQVLGYFVAYTSESGNPPLVFVLSEKSCKVLLFPFVNNSEEDVIESLLLPDIAVWIEKDSKVSLNKTLLVMLLLLSCTTNRNRMKCKYLGTSTRKSLIKDRIQTVEEHTAEINRKLRLQVEQATLVVHKKDQELDELRSEAKKMEKELKELKEQLAEFKSETKKRTVSFLERGSSSTTTVLLQMCKLTVFILQRKGKEEETNSAKV